MAASFLFLLIIKFITGFSTGVGKTWDALNVAKNLLDGFRMGRKAERRNATTL
jgi:hypothetical protein